MLEKDKLSGTVGRPISEPVASKGTTAVTSPNDEWIQLAQLPREIEAATGRPPPPYRAFYSAVIDGRLPAVRLRGRWYVERNSLPRIIAEFAPAHAA